MEGKRGPQRGEDDDIDARIEKLKQEAEAINGGPVLGGFSPAYPAELQEQFWKRVMAFETAPAIQPFAALVQAGIELPPLDDLQGAALTAKLWEVVNGLACLAVYLDSTDHLSDRELYGCLWSDILREPIELMPEGMAGAWHLDLTGRGGEEQHVTYLKYYADEEDRRHWLEDFPDEPLPDVEPLPFDRDQYLPQPHYGSKPRAFSGSV